MSYSSEESGIYRIINHVNGKSYIGYSKHLEERWAQHKWSARQNTKVTDVPLYRAIRKYGIENFEFCILELCEVHELKTKEKEWIEYYDTYHNGYNATLGGDGGYAPGEQNNWSKLTEKEVIYIREQRQQGSFRVDIYQEFKDKMSLSGFASVWEGKTWKHIMPEIYTGQGLKDKVPYNRKGRINLGETNGMSKLTTGDVLEIISLLENTSISQTDIARDFGKSYNTINEINRCITWKHLHNYKENIRKEAKEVIE